MIPPKPTRMRAVPPAALVVWPWLATKFAGSPASKKGAPSEGAMMKGPPPEWWRKKTMEETRARVTAASTARRKVVNAMGK